MKTFASFNLSIPLGTVFNSRISLKLIPFKSVLRFFISGLMPSSNETLEFLVSNSPWISLNDGCFSFGDSVSFGFSSGLLLLLAGGLGLFAFGVLTAFDSTFAASVFALSFGTDFTSVVDFFLVRSEERRVGKECR